MASTSCALPRATVVEAFVAREQKTIAAPTGIGRGDRTVFIAGDGADATSVVTDPPRGDGWTDVLNPGGGVRAAAWRSTHTCTARSGWRRAGASASRPCPDVPLLRFPSGFTRGDGRMRPFFPSGRRQRPPPQEHPIR
ncbi:hypothetical protein GCM10009799_02460 [Nocardiopsis rhodophaea]|uniref:Uncharacterized protein n=1 Tax=Nocardiopsis rhodophaea TaxID=280238 RepID=A0ABN2S5W4_9ACTN